MPKKKPAKQLPKSFRPAFGAASDLTPELAAQKLFYQIAQVVGVDEAAAIFKDTARRANEAAQSVKPKGRPKGSRNNVAECVRILTAWQIWQTQQSRGGKPTRESFADWYSEQEFATTVGAENIIRQLNRLLKPN